MKVGAVIMASGASSRFGDDNKLMMPYKEHSIIQQVVATALAAKIFERLVLVTSFEAIEALYQRDKRVETVMNRQSEKGLSESVKLGTAALEGMDAYMYIPGDQVLLSEATLKQLKKACQQNPECIIMPTYDGHKGSPKIFPARMKTKLLSLEGDDGGRQLVHEAGTDIIEVVIERIAEQKDVDTYEDYRSIRKEKS